MTALQDSGYLPTRHGGTGFGLVQLVLGIWLFLSPWMLGYAVRSAGFGGENLPAASAAMATWDAWILGAVLAAVALSAIARLRLWQDHVTLVIGAWLFAAPWVLGFHPAWMAACWDHWMTGLAVFLLSAWSLPAARSPI